MESPSTGLAKAGDRAGVFSLVVAGWLVSCFNFSGGCRSRVEFLACKFQVCWTFMWRYEAGSGIYRSGNEGRHPDGGYEFGNCWCKEDI